MSSLTNPYKETPGQPKKPVQARISVEDYYYLKRLFPMKVGIVDKTIATLYHKLVNEFKSAGLDPDNSDHCAWSVDHPTYRLAETIVSEFCRCTPGRPAGEEGPRDDGRGVLPVREAYGDSPEQRPDKKGGGAKRKRAEEG